MVTNAQHALHGFALGELPQLTAVVQVMVATGTALLQKRLCHVIAPVFYPLELAKVSEEFACSPLTYASLQPQV